MGKAKQTFGDFGILPGAVSPPGVRVRAGFSTGRVAGQYVGTAIVSLVGLGLAGLFLWLLPVPLNLLGAAAAILAAGALVYLATRRDYRWVELDGRTLRAKHLYTGRIVERRVDDVESLGTMVYPVRTLAVAVVEGLLGRVKGIEVRFRDRRTPLRVTRADPAMTNARELIEAIVYRMSEARQLDADVLDFNGRPLVRRIFWRGETPFVPKGNANKVAVVCFMLLAGLFGMILAFMSAAQRQQYRLTSVPSQEITLRSLIDHGPGENRYLTLTAFRPGGFASEETNGHWSQVWVALFPAEAKPGKPADVAAVLSTSQARNDSELRELFGTGRVSGICSASTRASWGTTLGPQLLRANPGCRLDAAWSIEHVHERPRAEDIRLAQNGAAGCFGIVILLAAGLFWKA